MEQSQVRGFKMKVAVTGHRPNKLWGYDLTHLNYIKLQDKLGQVLKDIKCDYAISGMALGVDTIFALTALDIGIKLECAIPCLNQSKMWSKKSRDTYNEILKLAHKVTYVSDKPYAPRCMQLRNKYMVDIADKIIAVWDGSAGGTANCVRYAEKQGKPIYRIDPKRV